MTKWLRILGRAVAGGAVLLAACSHQPDPLPQVTGHQGGLLPGMKLPDKPSTPLGYNGIIQQMQPDGRLLDNEYIDGVLVSQTWISPRQLPVKAVYFLDGNQVACVADFDANGKITKRSFPLPGTMQLEHVEEYEPDGSLGRATYYWPNGNLKSIREINFPTADGPVVRLQEWYPNGRPQALTQVRIVHNPQGQELYEEKQGRQTMWNEDGYRLSDVEYTHGQAVYDYLTGTKMVPKA